MALKQLALDRLRGVSDAVRRRPPVWIDRVFRRVSGLSWESPGDDFAKVKGRMRKNR